MSNQKNNRPTEINQENRPKDLIISGAQLLPGTFRNFSGVGTPMNHEGSRNFNLLLDPDSADELIAAGWNVKWTKEQPDRPSEPYMKVNVKYYDGKGPDIDVVTPEGNITKVTERTVGELDRAYIDHVDIHVYPKWYDLGFSQGWSARLRSMNVYLKESLVDPIKKNLDVYRQNNEEDFGDEEE